MKMPETSTNMIKPVTAPADPARWYASPVLYRAALACVAAIPVMLVNSVAFIGQFEFLHTHVPWILPGQVLFAVALESVAVYLAWHAHIAKMANDSSGRIMLSAYLFALVIASMNYSHYAGPHWRPTFMAVGLALMSASSPWLWNIHSRRVSRDLLMARGLLEEKAVRLGATRWTWHPYRSMRVTWLATWDGEANPKRAIAMLAAQQEMRRNNRAARHAAGRTGSGADRNDGTPAAPAAPLPAPAQAEPVPARQPLVGITGGAAVSGTAALSAAPSVAGGKRPDLLTIMGAVQSLSATSTDRLPSIRSVARDLLGDENQRRLGEQLLKNRMGTARLPDELSAQLRELAEEQAAVQASGPLPGRQSSRPTTTMIASPAGFAPGGIASVRA
jgi:hypothetical protein